MMKGCPNGQKYCNAFCQKFMNENEFYDMKANCKECFNFIIKIRKMIDTNQITAEQFRENPDLVQRDKTVISIYRKCKTCEEEKTLEKFEASRKECIICRKNRKKIKYADKLEEYITAIDDVKTNIPALTNLVRGMSADLVKLVIKHYKISISHPNKKRYHGGENH